MNENSEEQQMRDKLGDAGKMAEDARDQRRRRAVKGSHLLDTLVSKARDAGCTVKDNSGFYKFTGDEKGKAIYVAKKGGRVDLSGFTVERDGIRQITEDAARDTHLGKVRGQIDFNKSDDVVLSAYAAAVSALGQNGSV